MVVLSDPERRDAILKTLFDNPKIIEDENREKQRILTVGGLFFLMRKFLQLEEF